jgi:phosphopantothenoylcysteine synthetase/decarboxylase
VPCREGKQKARRRPRTGVPSANSGEDPDMMARMRFLVTAGNTRERIDDVRDWGNIFTGNTGYAIARALAGAGAVDLLTSNRQHLAELQSRSGRGTESRSAGIRGIAFTSHAELRQHLAELMTTQEYDGVFMTAAVADYQPVRTFRVVSREAAGDGRERWVVEDVQAGKVGSGYERIAVLGRRTEKLVDLFRTEWGYRGMLVKFKLEVGKTPQQLLEIGRRSRLAMTAGDGAGAYLIGPQGEEWIPRADLPARLLRLATLPSR